MTRTKTAVVVLALGVALGGAALWRFAARPAPPGPAPEEALVPDPPPPDPRLTFETAFRNVKPDVRYVGDASCATCHRDICQSYHAHPMGRSAFTVADAPPLEQYAAGPDNPRLESGHEIKVTRTATGATHQVTAKGTALPSYTLAPTVAIGSGTRGRSYLAVEGGAVWQSAVSWYTADARWGASPGFDLGTGRRRPIVADCLFCHVDQVEPVPGALNRYREPLLAGQAAIGCERCHGPGALHAAERADGKAGAKVDTSIVNPKHLPGDLRAAVCEQCHLQGQERVARRGRDVFEFRPGLPFEQFVTVFVRHPDLAEANRSVGQFEQMERSRCFTASAGRLGCTSCHEPHATPAPADRDRFFRGRCLTCHEPKACPAPAADRAAKQDSCTACHMPRTGSANIAHASVTDHRILARPGAPRPPRRLAPGEVPLLAFRTGPHAPPRAERERDLGLVLARLAPALPADGAREGVAGLAVERLRGSLAVWRGDADAWVGLARAQGARGETKEALEAARTAVRLAPDSEPALAELASAAVANGQPEVAVGAATKWIELNPTASEPRVIRASAYLALADRAKAEADARAALALNPLDPQPRLHLAVCLHRGGDILGGRREAEAAAARFGNPQRGAQALEWYARETR